MPKKASLLFAAALFLLFSPLEAQQLHVCTVASQNVVQLQQLLHSCDYYGITIDVLGLDLPYKGNGQKLIYIRQYIETIPDDDIVLFVDGYDTLILADEQTIMAKFLNLQTNCVFGAETHLFPYSFFSYRFPHSPTKFKYLNSGTIISRAGYLKHLIDAISPIDESFSDQGQIMLYYFDHLDEIVLDYNCTLFLAMHQVRKKDCRIDKKNKVVEYLRTRNTPCVVHGNGFGKRLYQRIFDKLFAGAAL